MFFEKSEITEAEVAALIAEYTREGYRITREKVMIEFNGVETDSGDILTLEKNKFDEWEEIHSWYIEGTGE